jgi:hypothetical protein
MWSWRKNRKRKQPKVKSYFFFVFFILITKFESTTRASLWSLKAASRHQLAPAFGRTGMPRSRFDDFWSNLKFALVPDEHPPGMSHKRYCWLLTDTFVANFNQHRAEKFQRSDFICVDESISRWYGQGEHWINHGLPMYVVIDRKPDSGFELQNAACGCSGVMLWLKVVKTLEEESAAIEEDEEGVLHHTHVLKELNSPCSHSN